MHRTERLLLPSMVLRKAGNVSLLGAVAQPLFCVTSYLTVKDYNENNHGCGNITSFSCRISNIQTVDKPT